MIIDVVIPRGLAVSDEYQRPPVVDLVIHGVRLEVRAVERSRGRLVSSPRRLVLETPRSPCIPGTPGTAPGRGSVPIPCRRVRQRGCPSPWLRSASLSAHSGRSAHGRPPPGGGRGAPGCARRQWSERLGSVADSRWPV